MVLKMEGRITSHRQVNVGWNDYGIVEPIRMLPVDPVKTEVAFDGNPATVITHTATEISDSFGSRAATMVFTGDNQAYLVDEQGKDVQALSKVTVRATEYNTQESMPAKLPPNSAYTCCSELQVDGAERVRFAKPVPLWVDNFLGFDVSAKWCLSATTTVTRRSGFPRTTAWWFACLIPVATALSTPSIPPVTASQILNNNGSFSDEVQGLPVSRFQPGATFWRAEVKHFTPWDCNWPYAPHRIRLRRMARLLIKEP